MTSSKKKDFAQKPRSQEICLPDSGRSYCLQWILRLLLGPWSTALEDRVGQQHVWVIQREIHGTCIGNLQDVMGFNRIQWEIDGNLWDVMGFNEILEIKINQAWLEMARNGYKSERPCK